MLRVRGERLLAVAVAEVRPRLAFPPEVRPVHLSELDASSSEVRPEPAGADGGELRLVAEHDHRWDSADGAGEGIPLLRAHHARLVDDEDIGGVEREPATVDAMEELRNGQVLSAFPEVGGDLRCALARHRHGDDPAALGPPHVARRGRHGAFAAACPAANYRRPLAQDVVEDNELLHRQPDPRVVVSHRERPNQLLLCRWVRLAVRNEIGRPRVVPGEDALFLLPDTLRRPAVLAREPELAAALEIEDERLHLGDVEEPGAVAERGDAEIAARERRLVSGEPVRPEQLLPHHRLRLGEWRRPTGSAQQRKSLRGHAVLLRDRPPVVAEIGLLREDFAPPALHDLPPLLHERGLAPVLRPERCRPFVHALGHLNRSAAPPGAELLRDARDLEVAAASAGRSLDGEAGAGELGRERAVVGGLPLLTVLPDLIAVDRAEPPVLPLREEPQEVHVQLRIRGRPALGLLLGLPARVAVDRNREHVIRELRLAVVADERAVPAHVLDERAHRGVLRLLDREPFLGCPDRPDHRHDFGADAVWSTPATRSLR